MRRPLDRGPKRPRTGTTTGSDGRSRNDGPLASAVKDYLGRFSVRAAIDRIVERVAASADGDPSGSTSACSESVGSIQGDTEGASWKADDEVDGVAVPWGNARGASRPCEDGHGANGGGPSATGAEGEVGWRSVPTGEGGTTGAISAVEVLPGGLPHEWRRRARVLRPPASSLPGLRGPEGVAPEATHQALGPTAADPTPDGSLSLWFSPALTRRERAIVHGVAGGLGLGHASVDEAGKRRLVVWEYPPTVPEPPPLANGSSLGASSPSQPRPSSPASGGTTAAEGEGETGAGRHGTRAPAASGEDGGRDAEVVQVVTAASSSALGSPDSSTIRVHDETARPSQEAGDCRAPDGESVNSPAEESNAHIEVAGRGCHPSPERQADTRRECQAPGDRHGAAMDPTSPAQEELSEKTEGDQGRRSSTAAAPHLSATEPVIEISEADPCPGEGGDGSDDRVEIVLPRCTEPSGGTGGRQYKEAATAAPFAEGDVIERGGDCAASAEGNTPDGPCFLLVGAVDGVAEEVTDAPEDADTWEVQRVVVEVKNRIGKAKHPPPLYDQIQLVVRA